MKMKKIVFIVAALVMCAALGAQSVAFHGYMDYTNFAVGQQLYDNADGNGWQYTDPAAEFGSFYNGRTEANLNVTAANFEFNLGIRLGAGGGIWYNLYDDVTDGNTPIMFHQMNMKVQFFNQQVNVYTGRFEEWSNGYIYGGYVLGGQYIRDPAGRDYGQHFTGVEVAPYAVSGLRAMVGFPILPVAGNGVNGTEPNQWKNLYKKVMIMAQYRDMNRNIVYNAGFRPGTYYSGKSGKDGVTNYFGEGYVQLDLPSTIPGVKLNASYDIRYRKNELADKYVTMHYIGVSGSTSPFANFTLNFEERFVYADDHYVANNEKVVFNAIGLSGVYNLPGTSYQVGMNLIGTFAKDANGTAYNAEGAFAQQNDVCDNLAMTWDWMPCATPSGKGKPGTYIGVYAYPYFQKNFQNGYVRTGVEMQFTNFKIVETTQNFSYRVPVAFCFWY